MIIRCPLCNKELIYINENDVLNNKNLKEFIIICKNCFIEIKGLK